jgi:hypothetical protein
MATTDATTTLAEVSEERELKELNELVEQMSGDYSVYRLGDRGSVEVLVSGIEEADYFMQEVIDAAEDDDLPIDYDVTLTFGRRQLVEVLRRRAAVSGQSAEQVIDEVAEDYKHMVLGRMVSNRVSFAAAEIIDSTPDANNLDEVALVRGRPFGELLAEYSGLSTDLVRVATDGEGF